MNEDIEAFTNERPADRRARQRRRRRRRFINGFLRFLIWLIILVSVFVFGIGFGKLITEEPSLEGGKVTIKRERGNITATTPTETVVKTTTIKEVKTVTVKPKATND
jgi:hypothetical protein